MRELADCRAGWLYFCPAYAPLPAAVPRALLQGTVLTFLRGVLRSERRAAVRLAAQQGAAVLALQGGDPARMPGDLPALLHRCGAYVTATGSGPWAAAVRLPLSPALPCASRPPRQIWCWTATARQRYIWTGFAWRMWNKNSFFPETGKAPQTSQARPAPRTGEVPERQR